LLNASGLVSKSLLSSAILIFLTESFVISAGVLLFPFGALPANLFSTSAFTEALNSLSSLSMLA
jgi:hypothetical protein